MKRFLILSVLCFCILTLLINVNLTAQDETDNPESEKVTAEDNGIYKALVDASLLKVRSGPSTNFREVNLLQKGTEVIVIGESGSWAQIIPPPNTFCYIYKDFVDENGVVKGTNVNLRPTADKTFPVCGQVNKGISLKIEKLVNNEWYKIEAPKTMTCWVGKKFLDYLEPYNGEEAIAVKKLQLDAKKQKEEEDLLAKAIEMQEEQDSLPAKQRNYKEVIAAYENIVEKCKDDKIVKDAVKRLELVNKLQSMIEEYQSSIEVLESALNEIQGEYDKKTAAEVNKLKEDYKQQYDATGIIKSVGNFPDRPGTHRLVKGDSVLYYLNSSQIDLDKYIFKYVGIKGFTVYNSKWGVKVMEVTQIEVITPK